MRYTLLIICILLSIKLSNKLLILDFSDHDYVTATYYNPVPEQCSGDPLLTASGSRIDLNKLKSGKIRWIAISRDLKSRYKFGDSVVIKSSNPKINGIWIVKDVMGKRHKNRIDLLSHGKLLNKPTRVIIKRYEKR